MTSPSGNDVMQDSDWDLFEDVNADDEGIKDQVCVDPPVQDDPQSESKEEEG